MDFSWEPKGERFAIVSSSDPNLGNPGPGVTIKTDVSFYQLDRQKNDFRLLRELISSQIIQALQVSFAVPRYPICAHEQCHSMVTPRTPCRLGYCWFLEQI